jgi:protein-S-isoprenylcysteine O-methyltransferase Ste14
MMKTFALINLIAVLIYLFAIRTPARIRQRRAGRAERRLNPVDVTLDIVAAVFWQVGPFVVYFTDWLAFADYTLPRWAGWIGVGLLVAALLLIWRAYADLGRNWSPTLEIAKDHQLVTDGVYRYIRHPVYAAMWLWALANPLTLWNWIAGFGLLVVFVVLYARRVPREEAMMIEHFGEAYRRYREGTPALLPRFWGR